MGWLMPRLSDFRHEHPEIELMLNPTAQFVELAPGGIDVAVRYGGGVWRGLDAELLLPTTIVIVAAPSLIGDAARSPSRATSSTCPGCRSSAPARCRTGCAAAA